MISWNPGFSYTQCVHSFFWCYFSIRWPIVDPNCWLLSNQSVLNGIPCFLVQSEVLERPDVFSFSDMKLDLSPVNFLSDGKCHLEITVQVLAVLTAIGMLVITITFSEHCYDILQYLIHFDMFCIYGILNNVMFACIYFLHVIILTLTILAQLHF